MRNTRFLAIPLVMVFILACGLTNGIQQACHPAARDIDQRADHNRVRLKHSPRSNHPAIAPPLPQQAAWGFPWIQSRPCFRSPASSRSPTVLWNGKAASTVTLSPTAASSFAEIANGFSASFIGDPCNLGEITVTIPRTDQQATVDQGIGLINILFAGVLPPGTQISVLAWMTQEYATMPVGGQQQTTIGTMQFTLQRSQTAMVLDIVPYQ